MKRRDALKLPALALATPFISRLAFARPASQSAAIVIGVDKPGDFPALKAAASGARLVEKWLRAEGYDVYPFIDDKGPVKAAALYDTIAALITPPRLDKLIVYFAGHGLYSNGTETWLLTDALTNIQQAINLEECLKLARESGISNVIFVSDACRSNPDSLRSARISGSIIFPNLPPGGRPIRPDIDRFFAALPGRAAIETRDAADDYYGVYTTSLLDAFRSAGPHMTKVIDGQRVIPNRLLKRYLQAAVPSLLLSKGVHINQQPDAITECEDDIYIGKYVAGPGSTGPIESLTKPSLGDVSQSALREIGIDTLLPSGFTTERITSSAASGQFQIALRTARIEPSPQRDNVDTGISIRGSDIVDIWPTKIEPIRNESFFGQLYRCAGDRFASTAVVRFLNGGCTALAILPGYITNIAIEADHIASISYTRSRGSEDPRIAALRATVAASTKFGVFRIEGNREQRTRRAQQIADQIRVGKSFDPTLGIYAAYAYSDADIGDEVNSVRNYLKMDLGKDLFDTAMLAGQLRLLHEVTPFCPMLSQGWNLLRVKGVKLPEPIVEAGYHRRESLWTIFDGSVYESLARGLRSENR